MIREMGKRQHSTPEAARHMIRREWVRSSRERHSMTDPGLSQRYMVRERPRIGIWEVIDLDDPDEPVMFAGIAEDCEAWVNDPDSRDPGKIGWRDQRSPEGSRND